MAHQSRYGWRWALVLCGGLAWLSIGCSPQSLTMFLLPFDDNKKEPDYKLFPDKKFFAEGPEIKLVVLANFARTELRPRDHARGTGISRGRLGTFAFALPGEQAKAQVGAAGRSGQLSA